MSAPSQQRPRRPLPEVPDRPSTAPLDGAFRFILYHASRPDVRFDQAEGYRAARLLSKPDGSAALALPPKAEDLRHSLVADENLARLAGHWRE